MGALAKISAIFSYKQGLRDEKTRGNIVPTLIVRSYTSSYWVEGHSCCRDQLLAVVVISQHQVSSSNTVRSATPQGAR